MSKQGWVFCPNCRGPLAHLYIHVKKSGFKSVNLWWCPTCEDYYKLQKGVSSSHAIAV